MRPIVPAGAPARAVHTGCGQACGHRSSNRVSRLVPQRPREIGEKIARCRHLAHAACADGRRGAVGLAATGRTASRARSRRRCVFAAARCDTQALAPLSTSLVDKAADSRRGIGFHALRRKAREKSAKNSPAPRTPRMHAHPQYSRHASQLRSAADGAQAAAASIRPQRRPLRERACPHRLWTRLRTAVVESGSMPCAARPAGFWTKYRQARPCGTRRRRQPPCPTMSIRRRSASQSRGGGLRRVGPVAMSALSTIAVDKVADTRPRIGFHALHAKACGFLVIF